MPAIDTHVHVWDLTGGPFGVEYPWLTDALAPVFRTFGLDELDPDLDACDIDGVVLVQASDSEAETDELIRVARTSRRSARVVGWLPLADPAATRAGLARHRDDVELVGVRHLIHDDPDPSWMLRPAVAEGMALIAAAGLTFDAVAQRPDLLAQVPVVARRHPDLTVVLDHLGKPPIADGGWEPWSDLLAAAAAEPNVVAKISGLNTASAPGWIAADWARYIEHALDVFGPRRLMLGGDWPIALLAGDYRRVWSALLDNLGNLSDDERTAVISGTARRVYRFGR